MLINKYFPSRKITPRNNNVDLDHDFQKYARIGFIYLAKGFHEEQIKMPFYHTTFTNTNLISLAAASRTGHTILLQGPNASGKTSLVVELAKLAKRKLVLIQMTHETTVSDLIGSWTVANPTITKQKLASLVHVIMDLILHASLRLFSISFTDIKEIMVSLMAFYVENKPFFMKSLEAPVEPVAISLLDIWSRFECAYSLVQENDTIRSHCNQLKDILGMRSSESVTNFIFIEGPLLEAIRKGYWILLDNIGQASGDVLERLNSLAEADPEFVLYEGGKNETLRRKDNTIHEEFRLFTSFNTERNKGSSISSAFLNRCIVINLIVYDQVIDSDIYFNENINKVEHCKSSSKESVPAYQILKKILVDIGGGDKIANILMTLHLQIREQSMRNSIDILSGFKMNFRNLVATVKGFLLLTNGTQMKLEEALTKTVEVYYCGLFKNKSGRQKLRKSYFDLLQETVNEISDDSETTFQSTAMLDDVSVCINFGKLISGFLLYLILSFQNVPLKAVYSNESISPNLIKVVESLNKIICSYEDKVNNLHITIEMKDLQDCKTYHDVGLHLKEMFKGAGIIRKEKFENFPDVENLVVTRASSMSVTIKEYLLETAVTDIAQKIALLEGMVNLYNLVEKICISWNLFLTSEISAISLSDSIRKIHTALVQLSATKTYLSILKEIRGADHGYLLDFRTKATGENTLSKWEKEKMKQARTHAVVNVEKALQLAICSSSGIESRRKATEDMLVIFPEAYLDPKLIEVIVKTEFLHLKWSCILQTPNIFIQCSDRIQNLTISLLTKLNCILLLVEVFEALLKQTNIVGSLRPSLKKIKRDFDAITSIEKETSVKDLLNRSEELVQDDRYHDLNRDVKRLWCGMNEASNNVIMLKDCEGYRYLKLIFTQSEQLLKTELLKEWCTAFNNELNLTMFTSSIDSSFIPKNLEKSMFDAICLYKVVLADLRKEYVKVKLHLLLEDEMGGFGEIVFSDFVTQLFILISPCYGTTIIIDKRNMFSMTQKKPKIGIFQAINNYFDVSLMMEQIESAGRRHQCFFQMNKRIIQCPKTLPQDMMLFFAAFIVHSYWRSDGETNCINFTENDLNYLFEKANIEMKQTNTNMSSSSIFLPDTFELVNDVIEIFSELQNKDFRFDYFHECMKKLQKMQLANVISLMTQKYDELYSIIEPINSSDKAGIYTFLKLHEDRLSGMKIVSRLLDEVQDAHTQQHNIIFDLLQRMHETMNKCYVWSLCLNPEIIPSFYNLATKALMHGFDGIISNLDIQENAIRKISDGIIVSVTEVTENLNELLANALESNDFEKISFDIALLNFVVNREGENKSQHVILDKVSPETTDKNIWLTRIDYLQNELYRLHDIATTYSLYGLLEEIRKMITDLNRLRMIKDLQNETEFNSLKLSYDLLNKNVINSKLEMESEQKTSPLNHEEIKILYPTSIVTEQELSITKEVELQTEVSDAEALKKRFTDVNATLSCEIQNTSEKVFSLLVNCIKKRKSVEIIQECIGFITEDISSQLVLQKVLNYLPQLESSLSTPRTLLCFSNIKILLEDNSISLNDLKSRLMALGLFFAKEHIQALKKIPLNGLNKLYDLVTLSDSNNKVTIGTYNKCVTELAKFQLVISRFLQEPSNFSIVLKQDFLLAEDFLFGIFHEYDVKINEFDQVKIESFLPSCSHNIFVKESLDQFWEMLCVRMNFVKTLAIRKNDSSSPAYIFCCNLNIIFIIKLFWEIVFENCDQLTKLRFEEQLEVLAEGTKKQYEIKKNSLCKRNKSLLEEIEDLDNEYKKKLGFHKKRLAQLSSGGPLDVANEERKWSMEVQIFEKQKTAKEDSIQRLNEEVTELNNSQFVTFQDHLNCVTKQVKEIIVLLVEQFSAITTDVSEALLPDKKNEELAQYSISEDLYTRLSNDIKEPIRMSEMFIKMAVLNKNIESQCQKADSLLKSKFGKESYFSIILKKMLSYGICAASSITRCIHNLIAEHVTSEKEKSMQMKYFNVCREIISYSNDVMKKDRNELKNDHVDTLIGVRDRVVDLCSQVQFKNKSCLINILHLKKFYSRFLLFSFQKFDKNMDSKLMEAILKDSGLSEFPTGHSQMSFLQCQILQELRCIYPESETVSVYAIAEIAKTILGSLSTDLDNSKACLEDETKSTFFFMMIDLINISNALGKIREELYAVLIRLPNTAMNKNEIAAFNEMIDKVEAASSVFADLDSAGFHNPSELLIQKLCCLTFSNKSECYRYVNLPEDIQCFQTVLCMRREKLKSRMEGILKQSDDLTHFTARLILSNERLQLLHSSSLASEINFKPSMYPQNLTSSFLFREYFCHATKDIIKLVLSKFQNRSFYNSPSARFEHFIVKAYIYIRKAGEYINKTITELNECFLKGDFDILFSAEFIDICREGLIDFILIKLQSFQSDVEHNTGLLNTFIEISEAWNLETKALFQKRLSLNNDDNKNALQEYEEHVIAIEQNNRKLTETFNCAMTDYLNKKRDFNALVCKGYQYICLLYLKLKGQVDLISQEKFKLKISMFTQVLVKASKMFEDQPVDTRIFVKVSSLMIHIQHLVVPKRDNKKVKKLLNDSERKLFLLLNLGCKETKIEIEIEKKYERGKRLMINLKERLELVWNQKIKLTIFLLKRKGRKNGLVLFKGEVNLDSPKSGKLLYKKRILLYTLFVEEVSEIDSEKMDALLANNAELQNDCEECNLTELFKDFDETLSNIDQLENVKEPDKPKLKINPGRWDPCVFTDFEKTSHTIPLYKVINISLRKTYMTVKELISSIMEFSSEQSTTVFGTSRNMIDCPNKIKDFITKCESQIKKLETSKETFSKEMKMIFSHNSHCVETLDDIRCINKNRIVQFLKNAFCISSLWSMDKMYTKSQKLAAERLFNHVEFTINTLIELREKADGMLLNFVFVIKNWILTTDRECMDDILSLMTVLSNSSLKCKNKIVSLSNELIDEKKKRCDRKQRKEKIKCYKLTVQGINVEACKLHLKKSFTIVTSELNDTVKVNLGKCVKGIGNQNNLQVSVLLFNPSDLPSQYSFNLNGAFVYPVSNGVVKSNENVRLKIALDTLSIVSDNEITVGEFIFQNEDQTINTCKFQLQWTLEHFDFRKLFPVVVNITEDGIIEYNLGVVSPGRVITRTFCLENTYNFPLRVKFSCHSVINFFPKDVILKSKEKAEQNFSCFLPKDGKGIFEGTVFCSASINSKFKLLYQVQTPQIYMKLDGKILSRDYHEKKFSVIPGSETIFEGLTVESRSELPLSVNVCQFESNSISLLTNKKQFLHPFQESSLKFKIYTTKECNDNFHIQIIISENDGFVVLKRSIMFRVESAWPTISVKTGEMYFHKNEIGIFVAKSIDVSAQRRNVEIFKITGKHIAVRQVSFPVSIEPKEKRQLQVKVRVQNLIDSLQLQIHSNCKEKVKNYSIKCTFEKVLLQCEPFFLNFGYIDDKKSMTFLVKNVSSSPSGKWKIKKSNVSQLEISVSPTSIELKPQDSLCITCTVKKRSDSESCNIAGYLQIVKSEQKDVWIPLFGCLKDGVKSNLDEQNVVTRIHDKDENVIRCFSNLKSLIENNATKSDAIIACPIIYVSLSKGVFSILKVLNNFKIENLVGFVGENTELSNLECVLKESLQTRDKKGTNDVMKMCDTIPQNVFAIMLRLVFDLENRQKTGINIMLLKISEFFLIQDGMVGAARLMNSLIHGFTDENGSHFKGKINKFVAVFCTNYFQRNSTCQTISELINAAIHVTKPVNNNEFLVRCEEIIGIESFSMLNEVTQFFQDVVNEHKSIIEAVNDFLNKTKLNVIDLKWESIDIIVGKSTTYSEIKRAFEKHSISFEDYGKVAFQLMEVKRSNLSLQNCRRILDLIERHEEFSLTEFIDLSSNFFAPGFEDKYSLLEKLVDASRVLDEKTVTLTVVLEQAETMMVKGSHDFNDIFASAKVVEDLVQDYKFEPITFDIVLEMSYKLLNYKPMDPLTQVTQLLEKLYQFGKNLVINLSYTITDLLSVTEELILEKSDGNLSKQFLKILESFFNLSIGGVSGYLTELNNAFDVCKTDGCFALYNLLAELPHVSFFSDIDVINFTENIFHYLTDNPKEICVIKLCKLVFSGNCLEHLIGEVEIFLNVNQYFDQNEIAAILKHLTDSPKATTVHNRSQKIKYFLDNFCSGSNRIIDVMLEIYTYMKKLHNVTSFEQLALGVDCLLRCTGFFINTSSGNNAKAVLRILSQVFNNKRLTQDQLFMLTCEFLMLDPPSVELENYAKLCEAVMLYKRSVVETLDPTTKELFEAVAFHMNLLSAPESVITVLKVAGLCFQFCSKVKKGDESVILVSLKLLKNFVGYEKTQYQNLLTTAEALIHMHEVNNAKRSIDKEVMLAVAEWVFHDGKDFSGLWDLYETVNDSDLDLDLKITRISTIKLLKEDFKQFLNIVLVIRKKENWKVEIVAASVLSILDNDTVDKELLDFALKEMHFSNNRKSAKESECIQFLEDVMHHFKIQTKTNLLDKFYLRKELVELVHKLVQMNNISHKTPQKELHLVCSHVLKLFKLLSGTDATASLEYALYSVADLLEDSDDFTRVLSVLMLQLNCFRLVFDLEDTIHDRQSSDMLENDISSTLITDIKVMKTKNVSIANQVIKERNFENITTEESILVDQNNSLCNEKFLKREISKTHSISDETIEKEVIKVKDSVIKATLNTNQLLSSTFSEMFSEVSVKYIIKNLSFIYDENVNMEMLLDHILHREQSLVLVKKIPEVIENCLEICFKLYQVLMIMQIMLKDCMIKGGLTKKIQLLKKLVTNNFYSVLEVLPDSLEKDVSDQLRKYGVNLKSKTTVDDYNITEDVGSQLYRYVSKPCPTRLKSTEKTTDIGGKITLANFLDSSNDNGNTGMKSYWLSKNSSFKEKYENRATTLHGTTVKFKIIKKRASTDTSSKRETKTRLDTRTVVLAENETSTNSNLNSLNEDVIFLKVDPFTINQKINFSNITKQQNLSKSLGVTSVAQYKDPEDLPEVESHKLRYPLLARLLKGIQSECFHIMKRIKNISNQTRSENVTRQTFKFLFLVDNSGSMNGEKIIRALNILVVFLETMKRLEYQTAVVRFGGEETQTVLKHFDQQMDANRGQYIIESFDASEKTLAANALSFVATQHQLYGNEKSADEHRFILLITDGIWPQSDGNIFNECLQKADARLMVFTTHPRRDKDLKNYNLSVQQAKQVLDIIAPNGWVGLDTDEDINKQLNLIADKIDLNVRSILDGLPKTDHPTFSQVKIQTLPDGSQTIDGLKYKHTGNFDWSNKMYISNINKVAKDSFEDNGLIEQFLNDMSRNKYDDLQFFNVVSACHVDVIRRSAIIEGEEEKMIDFINDLDSVVDCYIFPNNRPTRLVQDFRGPSFSLKGFIKFLSSNGQYKKIYENMIGSPRKDYLVTIILDVSASMAGMAAVGSIKGLIGLAAAIHRNDIDFNIITAGEATTIVKTFDNDWNTVAKAHLYEALTFTDESSNLGDAVLYAACLLNKRPASNKTVKSMFIITDGYASAPARFKIGLAYAESLGIQTIGLGMGYLNDAIFDFFIYHNYVVVGDPGSLPEGLRQLFCADIQKDQIPESREMYMIQQEEFVEHEGEKLTGIDDVWNKNMMDVYTEQVEKTKKAIHLAIHPARIICDTMTVDICFALDSTGSMRLHIDSAKKYIRKITIEVSQNLHEKYGKTAKFRVAFVTYKARCDDDHLKCQVFTDDVSQLEKTLNTVNASGGRDGGEDKYDAIEKLVEFDWKSTVKFLVLVGDMPGNDDRADVMPAEIKKIAEKDIYLMYVTITENTKTECEQFKTYYNSASTNENGFAELSIINESDSDKLKDKITERIYHVICSEFL